MKFSKMHGAGNDYIIINGFENDINKLKNIKEIVSKMSQNHFGIGSDGVIFVCPSKIADAKMIIYNKDGSTGKMCGNGIRCVAKFLKDENIIDKNELEIETDSGIKKIKFDLENNMIEVNMGKASFSPKNIPVKTEKNIFFHEPVDIDQEVYHITAVSMGNPHAVIYDDNLEKVNIDKIGPKISMHSIFPEYTNVEFIKVVDENTIKVKVWERGSGYTLACGTGACAAAVCAKMLTKCCKSDTIKVILDGGVLYVTVSKDNILLKGDAEEVYKGDIDIKKLIKKQ